MPRGVYDRSKKPPDSEETTVAKPPETVEAPAAEPAVEQPCPDHFPDGWPDGVTSAGCVDGMWLRDLSESD